jgi:tetratricopeptide (TPR) repeat protein
MLDASRGANAMVSSLVNSRWSKGVSLSTVPAGNPSQAAVPAPPRRRGRRGRGVEVRPGSIREARERAHMTMAQVAGNDLTRGAIYLFETGRAWPSRPALEIIAARTGHDVGFFLAGGDPARLGDAPAGWLVRLSRLLADGGAQEVLDLANEALATATGPLAEAWIRIRLTQAAIVLGRPETALLHARDARRLVSGRDAGLEARAWLAEVEALRAAGDGTILEVATQALAAVRELESCPPGVEEQLLHLIGAVHAARGEWAEAEAANARVFESREQVLSRSLAALEHEARLRPEDPEAWWRADAVREVRALFAVAAASGVELGRARSALGQADQARTSLDAAAGFAETIGLVAERCRAMLGIADSAMRQNRTDEAREQVDAALVLADHSGDRHAMGLCHLLRGQLAVHGEDVATADVEFRRALADLEAAGRHDLLVDAHSAYAEVLQAQGRFQDAMEQWKAAVALARAEPRRQARAAGTW